MEVVLQEAADAVKCTSINMQQENTDVQLRRDEEDSRSNHSRKRLSATVSEISAFERDEPTKFSMLPKDDPVDIQFEKVSFTATKGIIKKETKKILHEINGRLPPGQLIAIMGPSGAGKSTLLNALSGYSITGTEGKFLTNGSPRDLNAFRKLSCYITQDDRLQGLLTVMENMLVAADLKLGASVPLTEKEDIIQEILITLGLYKARHTKTERLSGGQKKRLSIALELVNNPLVMFLDEPTTGLDSSSCRQCVKLLQVLARQGRTIVCTIHQPSASLFQIFDQVYVLAAGRCVYQGSTRMLVPFFEEVGFPCPMYHNPADYVIELACEEYGKDKVDCMVKGSNNGKSLRWMKNYQQLPSIKTLKEKFGPIKKTNPDESLHATSSWHQLKILLRRGFLKAKRDSTLTYTRIMVNVLTAIMLGTLYWQAGIDGSKVLDNYNLLFSFLMHHMMSTMMLTILTFPSEMNILTKEHFNRWYSLKMYYASVNIVDAPLSIFCCVVFSAISYMMTGQPLSWDRFCMFTAISIFVVFVAQSVGLMIGAVFDVTNGTFLGPTLSVPMMMFAGFGVALKDLPPYLFWGSYISYLRYGLEGYVDAIYGMNRETLECPEDKYCHYKYPSKFLVDIDMKAGQFWNDIICLVIILFFLRILAFVLLRWKLTAQR